MPFIQKDLPQYHYADDDGLIGLRGAMYYFQNIHTWHLHSIDKGNDVLPQKYEAGWIYTRYHVVLKQKMDYRGELTLRAWMEPYRQPVLVNENIEILQHGKIAACGKLECCVFSLARQRPLRLTAVDFPENFAEDVPNDIPDFLGIEKTADGTEERYIRTVRASDLDVNRHMNNLHYIAMFQDACDSSFWRDFSPKEMEICFMSQCKESNLGPQQNDRRCCAFRRAAPEWTDCFRGRFQEIISLRLIKQNRVGVSHQYAYLNLYFAQNALIASLANAAVPSPPALSMLAVISLPAAYICPRLERICLEQV